MKEDMRLKKGQEKKTLILEATSTLLAEEGMTGLSAMKIATQAGISKGLLFHHYKSIEDILSELFDYILEVLIGSQPQLDLNSLEGFFSSLGEWTLEVATRHRQAFSGLLQYYNYALTHPAYQNRILSLRREISSSYESLLLTFPGVSPLRAKQISDHLVITLDAFGMHYSLDGDREAFRKHWKLQSEFYCQALGPSDY